MKQIATWNNISVYRIEELEADHRIGLSDGRSPGDGVGYEDSKERSQKAGVVDESSSKIGS